MYRSATILASCGWLLPVSSLIELVAMVGDRVGALKSYMVGEWYNLLIVGEVMAEHSVVEPKHPSTLLLPLSLVAFMSSSTFPTSSALESYYGKPFHWDVAISYVHSKQKRSQQTCQKSD